MKTSIEINGKTKEVGDYLDTGIQLVGIGRKYLYIYSYWQATDGGCSGYARVAIEQMNYYGSMDYEWISPSKALVA